ncbi:hypothetical protein HZH68_005720 [Vespula germanica]|uniref:Uncharacterized protein n=1 Tax=Vespula germanica TaxID=30212 RepID=A0A834KLQ6_VESGE|nr:hypothetical protein HZH68_005720 [Vespula germanica]
MPSSYQGRRTLKGHVLRILMPLLVLRCAGVPQRLVFAVMGFFAIFNAYVMRVCLSIALTQMVIPSNKTTNASLDNTCPVFQEDQPVEQKLSGTYDWSVGQQSSMCDICNLEI